MKKCKSCQTALSDLARFCHNCGRQVEGDGFLCLKCNANNPAHAKFCHNCGFPINVQYQPKPNISPIYRLDFNELLTLPTQLKDAFLQNLSLTLDMEGESHREAQFVEAFDSSNFRREMFEEASIQIAAEAEQLFLEKKEAAFPEIERYVETVFLRLNDIFYTRYIPYLLPHQLSPYIPDYSEDSPDLVNLQAMFRVYLSLSEESVKSYHQAIDIPLKKLSTARKSFFKHLPGEYPYIFIDQTLFGTGSEGVILTEKAIYWKAHFHKAAVVPFSALQQLQRHKNHLDINGLYFNVSDAFNYRLLKLLNRLRFWYK